MSERDRASFKVNEAYHFLDNMWDSSGDEFVYNFDAYLGAARAVTLVMQKQYDGNDAFESYYGDAREVLGENSAASVLLELRIHTQHRDIISPVEHTVPVIKSEIHERGERYHKNNLPPVQGGYNRTLHKLNLPLPQDVTDKLGEESLKNFKKEYAEEHIEIMCTAHLALLSEITERNPASW